MIIFIQGKKIIKKDNGVGNLPAILLACSRSQVESSLQTRKVITKNNLLINKIIMKMEKKTIGRIAVFAIIAVIAFNVNLGTNKNLLSNLSLADIEALAGDIEYNVPQKNNNPTSCTLYVDASGNVYASENGAGAGVTLTKVSGMQNFCEDVKKGETVYGCDPYNCHRRV